MFYMILWQTDERPKQTICKIYDSRASHDAAIASMNKIRGVRPSRIVVTSEIVDWAFEANADPVRTKHPELVS